MRVSTHIFRDAEKIITKDASKPVARHSNIHNYSRKNLDLPSSKFSYRGEELVRFSQARRKADINCKVPQQIPEKSEKVGKKAVDTVTPLLV